MEYWAIIKMCHRTWVKTTKQKEKIDQNSVTMKTLPLIRKVKGIKVVV